ncbi:MAG TPA: hypothetical protein VGM92_00665 [Candidatus Kapabacteria bacterium]
MAAIKIIYRRWRIEVLLIASGFFILLIGCLVQRIVLGNPVPSDLHILGVPLDDVYIHARFAQNLLHGWSYSFNPGETLTADTSPLWVLLIAIGGLFTIRLELVAILLSMIAYLAIGPGVYRVARNLFSIEENFARLAGMLTVLCSRLIWSALSGMETALAALLMLLVVEEHLRSRSRDCLRPREAMWLGLGLLVRPEFLFVAAVCAVDWLVARYRNRANFSSLTMMLISGAAIATPVFFLPLLSRGSFVFHSSVVQGAKLSFLPNLKYFRFAFSIYGQNDLILFILFVAGLWCLRKKQEFYVPYIMVIGLPVLQSFVAPQFRHHGRYLFIVFPLLILMGVAAWEQITRTIPMKRWMSLVLVDLMIAMAIVEAGRWIWIEANSVRNISDQHLHVVQWLRENMQPQDTLAIDDAGAIGYFLNKPVVDLTGLMTPSLWKLQHNQDSVWSASRAMGADVYIVFNRLNPAFYENHKDSLALQENISVRLPLTSSADTTMSIYRVKGPHS